MKVDVVSTRTCFCILNLLRNTPLPTNSARAILILRPRRRQQLRVNIRCPVDEKSDHRHRFLLCPRHERPNCRRAAEQRYERAPLHLRGHSITSSAPARSIFGITRPRAFAVLRLITSSNFIGACTGRSAGLAPRRMRLTYSDARRNWSMASTPYDARPPASAKYRYG